MMNSGDLVYIDYIGKIKDTGEIFDLTKEDVAKKEKIYTEKVKYKPLPVVIDGNFVAKGLDEALKEMKVGEEKTVEIVPEKAFGPRLPELVRLMPESKFKEQDIDATPGSYITINRFRGKILSVDGGRIRVDFNHPLAGKTLVYEVKIINEVKDLKEKISAIFFYFTGVESSDSEISITDDTADIIVKKRCDIAGDTKQIIASVILKWNKDLKKIVFSEVFEQEKSTE
jgi:FKBP-type peptidyl-prolyl cis-trans isomerase 2